jgi:PAS domain S-box-containing protein
MTDYIGIPPGSLAALALRIVADAPDAILYSDRNGIIQFWNGGCERIFGFASEEAIGRSLDIIIPASLRERHNRGHAEVMRTGHTKYGADDLLAVPALRKDGSRISVEFSIIPLKDETGTMIGMAAILRDVTQRFEELKLLRKKAARVLGPAAG